jgi:hypothetical protein
MAAIDRATRPRLFVGLTYPGDRWPDDPRVWHDQLDAFWKRLQRLIIVDGRNDRSLGEASGMAPERGPMSAERVRERL